MTRRAVMVIAVVLAAIVLGWLAYNGGYWAGAH